jgi:D-serine deaminase-like pyridoxal phosphate-dependent protein
MARLSRRQVMLGAAAVAGVWWLKPGDEGGAYSPYFDQLNRELQANHVSQPRLLIDLDRMDGNIAALTRSIRQPKTWRVVVKSLPSIPLLQYIMQQGQTNALMVFHQPFLSQLAQSVPGADILMGKPLPVAAVAKFYQLLGNSGFRPERQLQWLVDSKQRLSEYQQLARARSLKLRINLELDIGLRRGGFADTGTLLAVLDQIAADPTHLELAGFMGYEAFIVKLPGRAGNLARAKGTYREMVAAARQRHPQLFEGDITYNIAGSQTYKLYEDDRFFNDICAGSGVVMPTDFDIPTLAQHQPAAFIATPVLKKYDSVQISGLESAAPVFSAWDPNRQQAAYIYGGNWMADYVNPPGLRANSLWGHSSNQEMVNASRKVDLQVGGFVFLRPHQSEATFLQFGDLITLRGGRIDDRWPVLKEI